ncbi:Homeobox-leucine zipper protein family [Euphorbia peplus]|nr:Homeobox-leucine zipper protein family [Euphorbia peplus]
MDSYLNQSETLNHHHSLKLTKKRLGRDQLGILEASFCANQKLKPEFKLELARQLGVSPRQVAIWYQNRRVRHKSEAKEHEYNNIQQELGNVLAEKIRLEKEVCTLKHELKRVQEMLGLASSSPATTFVSDDDASNSYSPGNMSYKWPYNTSKVPDEELCAWLSCPVNMLEKYVYNQSLVIESVNCDQETYSDCKM